jgi:hypothetical protein
MQAKCPYCVGEDNSCPKCDGTGKIGVGFAQGSIWTRLCLDSKCGFENGGRIVNNNKEPPESPGECVICRGPTKWLLIGHSGNDGIEFINDIPEDE